MDEFKEYNNEDKKGINNLSEYINKSVNIVQDTNNQLNSDIILKNNSLYKSYSNAKRYINFSSEKNSIVKNLDFNQLLDLNTETKKNINLNNDIIYTEILNNLNDVINKLQIEDSRKQNFYTSKNNLYSNAKYFLNDLTNFDEEEANKLTLDLEDIKSKYDYYINNINNISAIDWEILDDLIKNFNEYCINFLNNIKNINNIKEYILLLKININQIFNDYFDYKNRQNNILLTNNKKKNFLNNKRKILERNNVIDLIDNDYKIKNNMIIISKDEDGVFNKYMYDKWKNDDIKNIYDKNLIPKYISLSIYISKNENEDNNIQIIQNIKNIFKKYLISYKNNYDDNYIKIKFCGICSKPKLIINKIEYLMKYSLNEKTLVKIYLFRNLKECLYKLINKINNNNNDNNNISNINKSFYNYYTTNINNDYLKQLIIN